MAQGNSLSHYRDESNMMCVEFLIVIDKNPLFEEWVF